MPQEQTYHLRRAEAGDAADIHGLVHAAYGKWVPLIGRNPLPMDVDYHEAINRHRFDLLQRDEKIVGLIQTYIGEDCLYLDNLCIAPDAQRQGLGQRLLAHFEDMARKGGHTKIRLDTNKLFTGNVELYQRTGFVIEWEKPVTGGIHVHMVKVLR